MLGPIEKAIEAKLKIIKTQPAALKLSFKKTAESNAKISGAAKKRTQMSTKLKYFNEININVVPKTNNDDLAI